MKSRLIFSFIMIWTMLGVVPSIVEAAQQKLQIVTTQTIFAELIRQIAGDKVIVNAIASPKYNVHFYQPKPSDVRKVASADLYVSAGLDLEAWSDPLLEAGGKPHLFHDGPGHVDLSQGIALLNVVQGPVSRSDGDIHVSGNPHFHMNPENSAIMVRTLLAKLKEMDPQHALDYQKNADNFLSKLEQKMSQWRALCAHCQNQEIISYHDDIVYLADFLGLISKIFIEPKPGIPPTPGHLLFLEKYIRQKNIKAIVLPSYYSRREAEKLSKKVGATIVVISQGVEETEGTEGFFEFFDKNILSLSEALK